MKHQAKLAVASESAQAVSEHGIVHFEKEPEKLLHPASIMKLLTAFLARKIISEDSQSRSITISNEVEHLLSRGTVLRVGDRVTFRELLLLMLLPSDNSAARVAAYIAGNELVTGPGQNRYETFLAHTRRVVDSWGWHGATISCAAGLNRESRLTAAWINQLLLRIGREDREFLALAPYSQYYVSILGDNPRTTLIRHTVLRDGMDVLDRFLLAKTGTIRKVIGSLAVLMEDANGVLAAATVLRVTPKGLRYKDLEVVLSTVHTGI